MKKGTPRSFSKSVINNLAAGLLAVLIIQAGCVQPVAENQEKEIPI